MHGSCQACLYARQAIGDAVRTISTRVRKILLLALDTVLAKEFELPGQGEARSRYSEGATRSSDAKGSHESPWIGVLFTGRSRNARLLQLPQQQNLAPRPVRTSISRPVT